MAGALDLPWAATELGTAADRDDARSLAFAGEGRRLGTLLVPAQLDYSACEPGVVWTRATSGRPTPGAGSTATPRRRA